MSIVYLPIASAFGQNVKPFDGALLYFYEVGTTTLKTVYTDKAETIPATNPVVADANGRFAAMYISGLYKAVLKDKNGVEIWSEDNLLGRTGDVIWQGNFDSTTNSSNYPASGNQGDIYVVTTGFTLATASGSHVLQTRDFIICNKDGATAIDADWDIQRGSRVFDKAADFTSKNLLIDVQGNTTVDVDADYLTVLNASNEIKLLSAIDQTYDITTDLMAGTSEKASTWYWIWIDSDLTRMLVPDLSSTTDGTTASKLVDSAADFVTDLVQVGDIVYNTTDLTQTTVTAIDDLNTLSLADDIFISGENYIIRMLSPTGLGAFKARLGAAYNNSSSNLDDSFYTQIQEEKSYNGDGTDFDTTGGAGFSLTASTAKIKQVNDWTGGGEWYISGDISFTFTSTTNPTLAISGILFKTGSQYATSVYPNAANWAFCRLESGSTTFTFVGGSASTGMLVHYESPLDKKPSYHT